MLQDLCHAIRLMKRQKAFTAAALMTLALGIGANTAIFSVVYGVLLRPLPYRGAERLVRLGEEHPGGTPIIRTPMLSNVTFNAWQSSPQTIEGIAGYASVTRTLMEGGEASRIAGSAISPAMFRLLGVQPAVGRLLHDNDALEGAPKVVVLRASFWRERYGADPSVIGRTMVMDGEAFTIVGVAPPGFYFPDRNARLWEPYRVSNTAPTARVSIFAALALMRPGVTPAQAEAEATAAARSVGPRHLSANLLFGTGGPPVVHARPLLDEMTARVRPALLVLLAAVVLVLVIACANVTNLLLSRGVARQRELAIRAAIGAGQRRLARQLMTETLMLSVAGGALGAAFAWALMQAVPVWAPRDFPRLADIRLDGVALTFAVLVSLAAGVLAGTLPALRATRGRLLTALREGAGASASAYARRLGSGLLAAEAALAVVLLIAAALLGRSFVRLVSVDPGFDARNVLMARVHLPPQPRAPADREERFAQALVDCVRALPGVAVAGVANMAPFVPVTGIAQVTLSGDAAEPITARALSYVVTPGFAEALSMRVLEGRFFNERDVSAPIRPLIINEAFARAHFTDGRPVTGRRFNASFSSGVQVEIVGVVANVLKDGLDTQPQAEMYNLPRDAFGVPSSFNLAIKTSSDPLGIVAAVREAVRSVDPSAAVDDVETLGSRLSASVSEPRFAMAVLIAFAIVALALAAIGLYGVLSYQVLQRRRELGVRAALGASRGALVGLVLREGMAVTAAGILIGLIAAAWVTRLMQGLLFGVTARDWVAFSVAPVTLLVVAMAATLIPARRAAAAEPIEALRCE